MRHSVSPYQGRDATPYKFSLLNGPFHVQASLCLNIATPFWQLARQAKLLGTNDHPPSGVYFWVQHNVMQMCNQCLAIHRQILNKHGFRRRQLRSTIPDEASGFWLPHQHRLNRFHQIRTAHAALSQNYYAGQHCRTCDFSGISVWRCATGALAGVWHAAGIIVRVIGVGGSVWC